MTTTQKILHWIESSTVPIRTPDLIAIVAGNRPHPRQRIWTHLRRLERNGIIRRTKRAPSGTFWTGVVDGPGKSG